MTGTEPPTEPSEPSPPSASSASSADPDARGGVRLVPVLLALTAMSGLIDAVTFLGLGHVFTANMTGNVVVLGFAAAGAPGFSVPHTATSLACFLAGAATGGRMARRTEGSSRRRSARVMLGVEAPLLAVAAAVASVTSDDAPATVYTIIALTAFAMGLRNATVRRLAVRDLGTTTVVTMTLTGLASDSRAGGGTGGHSSRRTASVAAMFAGAVLGAALVLHNDLAIPLLVAATTSAVLALTASGRE
ncbi:YoaK family protein [Streptomyces maremycinicus]|uniref:YoaK family protein n=1 Tax=Streptomyces maremycinicus TaxID=1679753 RepID=UPI0007880AE4|nr:YoaK family protein [Streptomyces sp. NBRC 110468]